MRVTRVSIDSYTPNEEIKATATVVLDNSLCIHHVHVIGGINGDFVGFPNTGLTKMCNNSKRYTDIVHPCSETLRSDITERVLKEYRGYSRDGM